MDPELKKLLEETLALTKENNEMLRSMRSRARWALALQILFYVVLVVLPLFLLQPLLGPFMDAINGTGQEGGQNIFQQYQELLK